MAGVTGLGSLPGRAVAAGVRLALEVAPGLPWWPEFPERGPWAGVIGRGAGVLAGLDAEWSAGEWRLAARPGVDLRRARATLRDDLDILEEQAHAWPGRLKVQVVGPWTLAAALLRPRGGRVLGDRAARADVAASLAQGTSDLLAQVARRLPDAELVLQVDEPSLPAVLGGGVPTEGGYFRHRAVDAPEAAERLAALSGLTGASLVHCCAPGAPVGLLVGRGRDGAGFTGVSLDATLVTPAELDAVAAAVEAGTDLFWGVLGAGDEPSVDLAAARVLEPLRPLGLGNALADRLWLTPTCGLAGAPPARVPRLFDALARAAAQADERLRA